MEILLGLLLYACAFVFAAWVGGRVNESGKMFSFFLLFYSIAPFFPFDDFQFFEYEVTYEWNVVVFIVYAAFLILGSLMALALSNGVVLSNEFRVADCREGLKFLWFVSLLAWIVDIAFNWSFFFLSKHEYILSIPYQTKNLLVFSIPAKELLVGACILSPFRGWMRRICLGVGLLALLHSLILGYRHIALLMILMVLLPRTRTLGLLILCVLFTFLGEVSNSFKAILALGGGLRDFAVSGEWWLQQLVSAFGVSAEQKAILSNLLIKLDNPHLFEFGRFPEDLALGLPVLNRLDLGAVPATAGMSMLVGTLEGQGTGYSIHLVMLESLFLALPVVAMALVLAQWLRGSMLAILAGEVMYSMMRNGMEYWVSQVIKLMFLTATVLLVNKLHKKIRSGLRASDFNDAVLNARLASFGNGRQE